MGIGGAPPYLTALLLCISLWSLVDGTYKLTSVRNFVDGRGLVASLQLIDNLFGTDDVQELRLTVRYETNDRLQVHITDNVYSRWEIPQSIIPRGHDFNLFPLSPTSSAPPQGVHTFGSSLEFSYNSNPFGFAVSRLNSGEVLFNSSRSYSADGSPLFDALVFKNQFLEISTQLPEDSVLFGLGESSLSDGMRLAAGSMYTLWATDIGSNIADIDLYSAYPLYLELRKGIAHGVLLLNSNGMDIIYGADYLTYRVIGGVLDFYFFAGPSPASVIDQYTQLVGRPAPMPFWSLGFHQCRYGYKNLEELESVVAGYAKAEIPLEVMWSDIDYMNVYKDFTIDPVNYPEDKLRAFVDKLHANHQKYIIIVDPGIGISPDYSTYQRGLDLDVYIKNQYGEPYLGQVWPGAVYYPDFLNPKIEEFWSTEIELFHKKIPFDGLWCDMNEPANFCTGPSCFLDPASICPLEDYTICCLVCNSTLPLSTLDDPPYKINCAGSHREINSRTIAMSARHYGGVTEYDAHNLYGMSETIVTNKALKKLTGKRAFVLSRSTFVGSGAHTAHWTGDNEASWNDLRYSIVTSLNCGLFGLPMVGADICGFAGDTWEELCNRWIQVGAFYPFSRNHAERSTIQQELYLWDSVAESARIALGLRYRLLPFLYTLLYESHTTGAPVMRPLFYEFPDDPVVVGIDIQFLVGSGILVSPVVSGGEISVKAYFPQGVWYNAFDSSETVTVTSPGEFHVLSAPLTKINVHLRQGYVIPMQEKALTTTAARKTGFTLVVVFSSHKSSDYAAGQLFLDDGEDIEMKAEGDKGTFVNFSAFKSFGRGVLHASVTAGEFALKQKYELQAVTVLGIHTSPTSVRINGVTVHPSVGIKSSSDVSVDISNLHIPLGYDFELSWEFSHIASV